MSARRVGADFCLEAANRTRPKPKRVSKGAGFLGLLLFYMPRLSSCVGGGFFVVLPGHGAIIRDAVACCSKLAFEDRRWYNAVVNTL